LEQNINNLIVKYLQGTCSQNERKCFFDWINSNQENEALFFEIKEIFDSGKRIDHPEENLWNKYRGKAGVRTELNIKRQLYRWIRYAAVITVLFGSLLIYMLSREQPRTGISPDGIRYLVVHNTRGVYQFTLPDSSKVWLHGSTTLTYPEKFTDSIRRVELLGEAYFNVTANPEYPFIVQTYGTDIRAVGTAFNVKAYLEDMTIETTLVEGSVRIETNKNSKTKSEPVVLKPNQKAMFHKSGQLVSINDFDATRNSEENKDNKLLSFKKVEVLENVNTDMSTSWKDRRWMVQGVNLGDFVVNIERRYGMKFIFADEELKNYKISATFEEETIEQLLNAIRLTVPMDYKIIRNQVYLETSNQLKRNYKNLIKTAVQ
jgi:ferric-dicitrate binding protein FerR (iron transport regulator)